MVPVSRTLGGSGIHVIQELMNRADQRGYVTFEDVLELLDEDSDDVNAIEAVLDELDELGIELRQHDLEYRKGEALVNPLQFREALNHLRDLLFERLRKEREGRYDENRARQNRYYQAQR